MDDQDLFWHSLPDMEREVPRRPTYTDTEEYFATPMEERSMETSSDSESEGWIQMLMPQDWYYELDPEINLPPDSGSDMEISLDSGSDMDVE